MSDPGTIHIHQIFYNEQTAAQLDPGFIPLDNTRNERPDWYELWPILNFLRKTSLQDDHWYGFLSPSFYSKTALKSGTLRKVIERYEGVANVAIVSVGWDQIAYFRNLFEQGETWHPGLMNAAQEFVDHTGLDVALGDLVMHSSNAVLCNFIVAKPPYWAIWQRLAEAFLAYVEGEAGQSTVAGTTDYGIRTGVPMKTFVQERFAPLILSTSRFNVVTLNPDAKNVPIDVLFEPHPMTVKALLVLDFLKQKYTDSGDRSYLDVYQKIRDDIPVKRRGQP